MGVSNFAERFEKTYWNWIDTLSVEQTNWLSLFLKQLKLKKCITLTAQDRTKSRIQNLWWRMITNKFLKESTTLRSLSRIEHCQHSLLKPVFVGQKLNYKFRNLATNNYELATK